jgi:hypothetical protein
MVAALAGSIGGNTGSESEFGRGVGLSSALSPQAKNADKIQRARSGFLIRILRTTGAISILIYTSADQFPGMPCSEVSLFGIELSEEARFALVESFRVERLLESEVLVVQMVAKLVEERTKESFKFDDLRPLSRAHPNRDLITPPLLRLVEPVELAGGPRRPPLENPDEYPTYTEGLGQAIDQGLTLPFRDGPVTGC